MMTFLCTLAVILNDRQAERTAAVCSTQIFMEIKSYRHLSTAIMELFECVCINKAETHRKRLT